MGNGRNKNWKSVVNKPWSQMLGWKPDDSKTAGPDHPRTLPDIHGNQVPVTWTNDGAAHYTSRDGTDPFNLPDPKNPLNKFERENGGLAQRSTLGGVTRIRARNGTVQYFDKDGPSSERVTKIGTVRHEVHWPGTKTPSQIEAQNQYASSIMPAVDWLGNTIGPDATTVEDGLMQIPGTAYQLGKNAARAELTGRVADGEYALSKIGPASWRRTHAARAQAAATAQRRAEATRDRDVRNTVLGMAPFGTGEAIGKALDAYQNGDDATAQEIVSRLPADAIHFIQAHPLLGVLDALAVKGAFHGSVGLAKGVARASSVGMRKVATGMERVGTGLAASADTADAAGAVGRGALLRKGAAVTQTGKRIVEAMAGEQPDPTHLRLAHLTSVKAKESIENEGRFGSNGIEIYALDKSRIPKTERWKKIVTFGVPDVKATVDIPQEFNQYFKAPPVFGPLGVFRRYHGVYVAPPGIMDFNTGKFMPNMKRLRDGSIVPMTMGNKAYARFHQGVWDYGVDGAIYGGGALLRGYTANQTPDDANESTP